MKSQRYNRRVPPELQADLEEMILKIIIEGEDPAKLASKVLYYVLREMRPDVFVDWKYDKEDSPRKTYQVKPKPSYGGKSHSYGTNIYAGGAPVPAKKTEANCHGKQPPPPYRGPGSKRPGYHNYY